MRSAGTRTRADRLVVTLQRIYVRVVGALVIDARYGVRVVSRCVTKGRAKPASRVEARRVQCNLYLCVASIHHAHSTQTQRKAVSAEGHAHVGGQPRRRPPVHGHHQPRLHPTCAEARRRAARLLLQRRGARVGARVDARAVVRDRRQLPDLGREVVRGRGPRGLVMQAAVGRPRRQRDAPLRGEGALPARLRR